MINLNIDITKLKSGIEDYALIDLDYSFSKEELEDTNIIELNNIKISAFIALGVILVLVVAVVLVAILVVKKIKKKKNKNK